MIRNLSFKSLITRSVLLLFFVFFLLLTGAISFLNYDNLMQLNYDKGSKYASSLARLTLEYFLIDDYATLEKFYQRLFSDRSITEVSLIKKDKCILYFFREKEKTKIFYNHPCKENLSSEILQGEVLSYQKGGIIAFYAPVKLEGRKPLAWVKVALSSHEVKVLLLKLSLFSALGFFMLYFLASMVLYNILSIPLNTLKKITDFAKNLPKQIGEKVATDSKIEELKTLEEALNYASLSLKEYMESLAEERERLLVTLLSIGDAVIVTDKEGRVLLMNKVAEELTGYTFEEINGKKVKEFIKLVSEITGETLEDPISAVLREGKTKELANHTLLIRRNGERAVLEDSASPIIGPDGSILGVVFVFRDVTEKRRIQQEMIKLEKMNLINSLAGGAAHDLNNLLAGIQNYYFLIQSYRKDSAKMEVILPKVDNLLQRASQITKRLLDLSKGAPLVKEVLDLKKLLSEVTDLVFLGTSIKVCLDIPEDLMKLEGDIAQLSEVFQNILINARDVLGSDGKVIIKAENEGDFVKISITDNGPGIPPEILPRIFDPFFTTKPTGTGLGLAIVQNIVENHGGRIEVFSEAGEGTTFVLYLPGTKRELEIIEVKPLSIEKLIYGKNILIVDDDPDIRESLREILTFYGAFVETAESGDEALTKFQESLSRKRPFDLVITDFTMPGKLSGIDLAKALKEIKGKLKIIGTSSYIMPDIKHEEYEKYFDALLPKPFTIETLQETLHKVLSQ